MKNKEILKYVEKCVNVDVVNSTPDFIGLRVNGDYFYANIYMHATKGFKAELRTQLLSVNISELPIDKALNIAKIDINNIQLIIENLKNLYNNYWVSIKK